MPILIEVLAGASQGKFFRVENGRTLGRSVADIVINDPNISGTHAKFDTDNKGQLILLDLDSSNGLILAGKKVRKIAMLPSVKFQIGRSRFVVRDLSEAEAENLAPKLSWQNQLRDYLTENPLPTTQEVEGFGEFNPLLILEFIRGPLAEEVVSVGFGPRTVGSNTYDIEVPDERMPDRAFLLVSEGGRPRLENLCGQSLTLNGVVVESQILQSNDRLESGDTVIQVRFK